MANILCDGVDIESPAEAALLRYADNATWAYMASSAMRHGEYDIGVDDLLDMFEKEQVTPVPHDVIENARQVLTDPEMFSDYDIARANRVLDKVAALGKPS